MRQTNFNKTVRLGRGESGDVFCQIKFTDGKLSISGVEGPYLNGNCKGACGQIRRYMNNGYFDYFAFADGWDKEKAKKFVELWDKWHLNDMRPNCEHQTGPEWTSKPVDGGKKTGWLRESDHPEGFLSKPCPVCGYKYGTAWNTEEVPDNVIEFLQALPDTDKTPAWV